MVDRLNSPSAPLPPLTPSPSALDKFRPQGDPLLMPPELTPAAWDRFVAERRVTGRHDGPSPFRWEGLQLADLTKARDWRPGAGGPSGKDANARITASYDRIDGAMRGYLGQPEIANWTTFGKYASREAGLQIARIEAMLAASHGDGRSVLPLLAEFVRHPLAMSATGLQMLKGGGGLAGLEARLEKVHEALVFGNTQIMMDIGPAFDAFLRAEQAGQDGVATLKRLGYGQAPLDAQGFMLQAFEKYQQARGLASRLAADPPLPHDEALKLMTERRRLVFEANVLVGIEEQMVCLQNPRAFGDPEVTAIIGRLSGGMTLTDARSTTQLLPNGGNWADFATRMGFQEVPIMTKDAYLITGHDGVKRAYVPNSDPALRKGTIYDYFRSNLDATPSTTMMNGDPAPMPAGFDA